MSDPRAESKRHWLGVVVTALNVAVVAAVIGGMLWLEAPGQPSPMRVAVRIDAGGVSRAGHALVVPFELQNQGDHTVNEVLVEVSLGEDEVQHVIPHLPRGSKRRGVAVFPTAPAGAAPKAAVRGYQEP